MMTLNTNMRAAIYSSYLDTFGGGEKYMMTVAEILSRNGFETDVLLDKHLFKIGGDYLKKELTERFSLNLGKVNFVLGPVGEGSNHFSRQIFLKKYSLLFYLTDGSIFFPSAKKNILHIQSPLVGQPSKNLWGKLKLKGWDLIIYNSNFTKENAQKAWPLKSKVIYPPVDVQNIKPLKKEKIILSVGRFFGFLKDKKQIILIESFKKLYESGQIKDWRLNLVGSAGEGDKEYLSQLKDKAGNLPVNFFPNLSYDDLIKMYGQSSIYWHASGFGEDNPTKMEHFGISTVEAMAGGCVPVVIGKGGQIEIVENGKSGFLWDTLEELLELTIKITKDEGIRSKISPAAILKSKDFSKEKFEQNILEISKN